MILKFAAISTALLGSILLFGELQAFAARSSYSDPLRACGATNLREAIDYFNAHFQRHDQLGVSQKVFIAHSMT